MGILKYLIGSVLAIFSETDGWVPIEKIPKAHEQVEKKDPSIWVLFSKNLGPEKMLVRFPEEPTYRYTETGDLEITSERDGETFILTIREARGLEGDFLSVFEGKWIHEHIVQTPHRTFHFKTLSDRVDSPNHRQFIASFFIERNS